ncbi:MAG: pyridoxine 5'-phosphate synthase [Gammaproteobacteria bacterium]|jgi:pyridoxine 5-phosphate synthase
MTKLSVNINKVALLRNSRGRDYPSVTAFAERCLRLGAHGITLHPRPDQRHATYRDVEELYPLVVEKYGRELNVEGYPLDEFMQVVGRVGPTQCTLVPDEPGQLTSDHGWDLVRHEEQLRRVIDELRQRGVRVSLFVDYNNAELELAAEYGADRIELYTEPYADSFGTAADAAVLEGFRHAAEKARAAGLGVNAGHDLNLENLRTFLSISGILEVSIGHALTVECIEHGVEYVIGEYLKIVNER